jgi:tRNA-dihydrouridine synthase
VDHFFKTGLVKKPPTVLERLACARDHFLALWEYKGERGVRQARKHMTWYVRGFPHAGEVRGTLARVETVEAGLAILDATMERLAQLPEDAMLIVDNHPKQ